MKRFGLTCVLLLCAGFAQADLYQSRQADGVITYSDRADSSATRSETNITHPLEVAQLPGIWQAETFGSDRTELTLRGDGSFVFNQFGDNTRTYMCGTWIGDVDMLNLTVKALKRQTRDGTIEQTDRTYDDAATILSAQRDRMIIVINGQKLVLNRAG